jgi:hypothetical protein
VWRRGDGEAATKDVLYRRKRRRGMPATTRKDEEASEQEGQKVSILIGKGGCLDAWTVPGERVGSEDVFPHVPGERWARSRDRMISHAQGVRRGARSKILKVAEGDGDDDDDGVLVDTVAVACVVHMLLLISIVICDCLFALCNHVSATNKCGAVRE